MNNCHMTYFSIQIFISIIIYKYFNILKFPIMKASD